TGATVKGDLDLTDATVNGAINLNATTVNGQLTITDVILHGDQQPRHRHPRHRSSRRPPPGNHHRRARVPRPPRRHGDPPAGRPTAWPDQLRLDRLSYHDLCPPNSQRTNGWPGCAGIPNPTIPSPTNNSPGTTAAPARTATQSDDLGRVGLPWCALQAPAAAPSPGSRCKCA